MDVVKILGVHVECIALLFSICTLKVNTSHALHHYFQYVPLVD